MPLRKLAHLSDLHLDLSLGSDAAARALVESLLAAQVDHAVVTGDLTHQGASAEFRRFRELFAPLLDTGRLTFIPGNHDRPGDDVVGRWMQGRKVCTVEREGLYMVCIDSTGPHNRSYFASHGALSLAELEEVDAAVAAAPREALTVLLLHHHVLPLPEESLPERLATRMGWPYASELVLGAKLVARVRGRCDLILHGHRHVPREFDLGLHQGRALRVYNSGSSTELGQFRVFTHAGGRLLAAPAWQRTAVAPAPRTARHNVLPALQYLANQLSTALF